MSFKSRVARPSELLAAVEAYSKALVAGDERTSEAFVAPAALAAHRAALIRSAAIRPFDQAVTLARARIGFQYIVKIRFTSPRGHLELQNRWREESDGRWRIVEVEDLGLRSPWKKPEEKVDIHA
jgi:hypothetical protein